MYAQFGDLSLIDLNLSFCKFYLWKDFLRSHDYEVLVKRKFFKPLAIILEYYLCICMFLRLEDIKNQMINNCWTSLSLPQFIEDNICTSIYMEDTFFKDISFQWTFLIQPFCTFLTMHMYLTELKMVSKFSCRNTWADC